MNNLSIKLPYVNIYSGSFLSNLHIWSLLGADAVTNPFTGSILIFPSGMAQVGTKFFIKLIAHEGSHSVAGTKDYYLEPNKDERIYDAYAYESVF